MYIYIESHVNGALTPFKHPAFHVKVSIYMEIGTVRPGGADAPPSNSPWFISPEQRIARYPRFPSLGPVQERKDRENCQKPNESQQKSASGGPLGGTLRALLGLLGASWAVLAPCWAVLRGFGRHGSLLGVSWALLEASGSPLGALLGASWGPLGPSWGDLGGLLGRFGASGS